METAICEVSEPPSPNSEHKNTDSVEQSQASPKKSPKRTKNKTSKSPEGTNTGSGVKERDKKARSAVGRSQSDRYSYREAVSNSPYRHDN